MKQGKTASGFAFCFDEKAADDMRFVELLGEITDPENDGLRIMSASAKALTLLLGKEQKAALYAHIAAKNEGRVPTAAVGDELRDILGAFNETKNF